MATNSSYGVGIRSVAIVGSSTLDMDRYWRRISGPLVVLYRVARRLVTPRGSIPWALDVGFDIRQLLLDGFRPSNLSTYERLIRTECEADPAVLSADVTMSYDDGTETLRLDILLHLADGPFRLVIDASKISFAIIQAAAA